MFKEPALRAVTFPASEALDFSSDALFNLLPERSAVSPRVTAIVVTFQSEDTLKANVASVKRCHDARVLDCIYVDNGSQDNSPEMLRRESGWAKIVLTGRNNGFGRGCNIGLAKVTSPYTLFLNPDAVIEPGAIRGMVEFLDTHPEVGIVGPATYCGAQGRPPKHQVTSALPTPWSVIRAAIPLVGNPGAFRPIVPGSEPFKTGWVCGAVMMIRTELALSLGGFDPHFFLYSEEIDLCLRAAKLGFETWAIGTVTARHVGGASSSDDVTRRSGCIGKHYYQSRRYYLIKHHGWATATFAELGEFGLICLGTVADLLRGRGYSRLRPRLQAPLFSLPAEDHLWQARLNRAPNTRQTVR
jgi:N-acetylglucosaminyl-diphospho-decaprenol L-rhamnosyltransferase